MLDIGHNNYLIQKHPKIPIKKLRLAIDYLSKTFRIAFFFLQKIFIPIKIILRKIKLWGA